MKWLSVWLLVSGVLRAQDPLLSGKLERGPHAVGFRYSIAYDESRKYCGKRGRPILVDVWYPAAEASGAGLAYGQYLRVPESNAFPELKGRLEAFVRDVVADDLFHKKTEAALNSDERALFDKLLATPTEAHRDAIPAAGRFPVVLYHPSAGGSFEENFVLFGYLASHGYVVVSSAFQSPYRGSVGNNTGGVERSIPDLEFLARQARRWPYADGDKLGALGHSAGAQIMLQWIGSPKCPVRAFVSLDTTVEYSETLQLHKFILKAIQKLTPPRIPVLLFAQARLRPEFVAFRTYLQHSPHYEAVAAELHHDDFLTHGFLGRTLLQLPEAGAIRQSYEDVCRTVLAFLDAHIKDDAQAARLVMARPGVRFKPADGTKQ